MTKKELLKQLAPFDENIEIFLCQQNTEYEFSLVESVKLEDIKLTSEDVPAHEWSTEKFILISD